MLDLGCQRWRLKKTKYRPAGEVIDTRHYEVSEILTDNEVKPFVTGHHYSGSFPAARFRYGLWRHSELVGVSVFSQPMRSSVITSTLPVEKVTDGVELGRFVLLDDVPGNGETWFLARCFDLLRQRVLGVVSYSDPMPRETSSGEVVFIGHIGSIYQAKSAVYVGRGTKRTIRLFDDGTVFSDQSMSKIRRMVRGWRYSVNQLVAHGAGEFDQRDPCRWLSKWRERLTRPIRHPGNLKYAWAFDKALRKHLKPADEYPKRCPNCMTVSPSGRDHEVDCDFTGREWKSGRGWK